MTDQLFATTTGKAPTRVEILCVWHYDDGSKVEEMLSSSAPDKRTKTPANAASMDVPPRAEEQERPPKPSWATLCAQYPGLKEATDAVKAARAVGLSWQAITELINQSRECVRTDGEKYEPIVPNTVCSLGNEGMRWQGSPPTWQPNLLNERRMRCIARALAPFNRSATPESNGA